MKYRNDVRITLSHDGYAELSQYLSDYYHKNNLYDPLCLLEHTDVMFTSKHAVYLGWNDIEWDESEDYVHALVSGLEHLKKNNYSVHYARIEEGCDVAARESFDGSKDRDITFNAPFTIRIFDDQLMFRWMKSNDRHDVYRKGER